MSTQAPQVDEQGRSKTRLDADRRRTHDRAAGRGRQPGHLQPPPQRDRAGEVGAEGQRQGGRHRRRHVRRCGVLRAARDRDVLDRDRAAHQLHRSGAGLLLPDRVRAATWPVAALLGLVGLRKVSRSGRRSGRSTRPRRPTRSSSGASRGPAAGALRRRVETRAPGSTGTSPPTAPGSTSRRRARPGAAGAAAARLPGVLVGLARPAAGARRGRLPGRRDGPARLRRLATRPRAATTRSPLPRTSPGWSRRSVSRQRGRWSGTAGAGTSAGRPPRCTRARSRALVRGGRAAPAGDAAPAAAAGAPPLAPRCATCWRCRLPMLPERRLADPSSGVPADAPARLERPPAPRSRTRTRAGDVPAAIGLWPASHCALEYHRWLFRSRLRADGRHGSTARCGRRWRSRCCCVTGARRPRAAGAGVGPVPARTSPATLTEHRMAGRRPLPARGGPGGVHRLLLLDWLAGRRPRRARDRLRRSRRC